MFPLLSRLLRRNVPESPATEVSPAADERRLSLERELQSLKLDRQELERTQERLRSDLEHQRAGEQARVNDEVRAAFARLAAEAAGPVSLLAVQAALLDAGKPVEARDVVQVARRLSRVLEEQGLALAQAPGDPARFDSDQHEPLSTAASLQPGDPVRIRLPGVSYHGKVLRKAGVEARSEE